MTVSIILVTKTAAAQAETGGEQREEQTESEKAVLAAKNEFPDDIVWVKERSVSDPKYLIPNAKNEIVGTKVFVDGKNRPLDEIPPGEYIFGLYEDAEGTKLIKTAAVPNEDGFVFRFGNLDPGTYYVYELDEDGIPITDDRSWMKGSATFKTTYTGNDGIKVVDGNSSEVTVTNTQTGAYELPETGGDGGIITLLHMASGMLVIGAGLLTIMKKRPGKQN